MSGWTAAIVTTLVALNPLGVARAVAWFDRSDADSRRLVIGTLAAMGAALMGLGLLAAPVLSLLDVSTQTFRLAAAVVIGISGAKTLLAPTGPITEIDDRRDGALTLATLTLTPAAVFAAMAANSDGGTAAGLVAVAIAVAATLAAVAARPVPEPALGALVRFTGAAAILVAVATGLDSARSV